MPRTRASRTDAFVSAPSLYHCALVPIAGRVTAIDHDSVTLAFVFPGQGSQILGMLAELAAVHPHRARDLRGSLGRALALDLWALSQQGPEDRAQPHRIHPAGVAGGRRRRVAGLAAPAAARSQRQLAGHSLGEYTALVAAGALALADGATLVRERGRLMQAAVPAGIGAMAAVLGAEDDAGRAKSARRPPAGEVVVPANFNSPGQIVIGGHAAAVDRALAAAGRARRAQGGQAAGQRALAYAADARGGRSRWREVMAASHWQLPSLPVVQNADAAAHDGVDAIRDALVRQLYLPVRWTDCVAGAGARGRRRASSNAARARC